MAKTLRDGDWLDSERAIGYARIILAVSAVAAILWVAAADRGIDIAGKPLGTDFLAFWSAGQLAISGHPASAYDLAQLYAVERGAVAEDPGIACFLYPPAFLLIVAPLAIFPYFAALPLWLAATGAAYWRAMRRWIGDVPHGRLALLAYPALAANLGHGQNGFLTAALLAGGLSQIDRRPVVAGALLGAMVIKPQLALALPVMALAGQRWQLTAGAIASASALCLASWLVLGNATWTAFLHGSATARTIIEDGLVSYPKMMSLSAAIHLLGGSISIAYAAQALMAIAAAAMLVLVCRRSPHSDAIGAVTGATTLLMSPFLLDYDLTIAAIPLAWLFGETQRRGFLPWEKTVLAATFILPLLARSLAATLHLPLAPVVLAALALATTRAALMPGASARVPA